MKLGFIGSGRIGSTTAFACLLGLDLDKIVLVDVLKDLAVGEAMDLQHAAVGVGKDTEIVGGKDYRLLGGSDLIVVSAGIARKPGMSRLDLASKNCEIIRQVARNIVKNCLDSKIIVVTNPMDVMTYIMWKETGKSRNEVFGMGNMLDSIRLWDRLNATGIKFDKAWVIGEHGDSMFIPRSIAKVKGEVDWDLVIKGVRKIAAEIIRRKGATVFGPAVAIYRMVRAVLEDRKEEIPTSMVLNGEYGIKNVAIGVPAILGKNGAEVLEYKLKSDELNNLKKSASIIRSELEKLGY